MSVTPPAARLVWLAALVDAVWGPGPLSAPSGDAGGLDLARVAPFCHTLARVVPLLAACPASLPRVLPLEGLLALSAALAAGYAPATVALLCPVSRLTHSAWYAGQPLAAAAAAAVNPGALVPAATAAIPAAAVPSFSSSSTTPDHPTGCGGVDDDSCGCTGAASSSDRSAGAASSPFATCRSPSAAHCTGLAGRRGRGLGRGCGYAWGYAWRRRRARRPAGQVSSSRPASEVSFFRPR